MAVSSSDIKFYLSGGSGNTDPSASLGGAISSTEIVSASIGNLFANVSGDEAAAGSVKYRCLYVKNTSGADTLSDASTWIQSNTTSADTTIDIGLDPAGISGTATEASPPDEDTAPSGVTFDHSPPPADEATGLAIGDLTAGAYQAIWVRRTVTAGATPLSSDSSTIRVQGTP